MEHNDIRHKLSEYIDDALPPADRSEIESHLKTCLECSTALTELRKTITQIKTIEEVEPPAWMTQKIMANVRSEAEKKSIFERFFLLLRVKLPIQAVAVLFLTITAFYVYQNMQTPQQAPEIPLQESAANRSDSNDKDTVIQADKAASRAKQVQQAPEYKALDMKLEYEKPAPPVPTDRRTTAPASAPALAKPAEQFAKIQKEELAPAKTAGKMRGMASEITQEQAAPAAGAPAQLESKRKAPAFGGGPEPVHDQVLPRHVVTDMEILQKVMTYFVNNDLPDQMKAKDVKIAPKRIQTASSEVSGMNAATIDTLSDCKNAYLVNAERAETKLRFLYCADNDAVKLIAKFEMQSGEWKKTK